MASLLVNAVAAETTASALLVYDSDSLARTAMNLGMRDFLAKHGTTIPLTITYEPGTTSPAQAAMTFEAASPDGKARKSIRLSTITGEEIR